MTNTRVEKILKKEKFLVKTSSKDYDFDVVIIATGGLSYPNTGSNGDGYKFAKDFGHKISKTYPSLVPVFFKDKDLSNIKALSLENTGIKIVTDKGTFTEFGSILLTKNFISGPEVLKISSFVVDKKVKEITLDLSTENKEDLDKLLVDLFDKNPNKDISNILNEVIPNALVEVVLNRSRIARDKKANQITKKERFILIDNIKNFSLELDKFGGFNTAVITKGGIEVDQINPKTMESKLVRDLYFIGEVLDIEALTGGFNLQLAFTTAFAAVSAIKESIWHI